MFDSIICYLLFIGILMTHPVAMILLGLLGLLFILTSNFVALGVVFLLFLLGLWVRTLKL